MKDFIFKNAKLIIVEAGATNRLGEIVAKLGVNRVIIVTDQGIVKAGLLTRAVATTWPPTRPVSLVTKTDPSNSSRSQYFGTPIVAIARLEKSDGEEPTAWIST